MSGDELKTALHLVGESSSPEDGGYILQIYSRPIQKLLWPPKSLILSRMLRNLVNQYWFISWNTKQPCFRLGEVN